MSAKCRLKVQFSSDASAPSMLFDGGRKELVVSLPEDVSAGSSSRGMFCAVAGLLNITPDSVDVTTGEMGGTEYVALVRGQSAALWAGVDQDEPQHGIDCLGNGVRVDRIGADNLLTVASKTIRELAERKIITAATGQFARQQIEGICFKP